MAKAKQSNLKLLKHLEFEKEYREDGGFTSEVQQGRFKYFREVSRRRNAPLLTANLIFMLFLLPLVAIFVLIMAFGGIEQIAYRLKDISEAPYLLSGIGFGISSADNSVLGIKLYMLDVYYLIMASVGVALFIASIGFGGMVHLSMKFIIGDTFISKKDNYGNNVPRAIKEYFKGFRRYWKQMLFVGAVLLVLFSGIGNIFVYFVGEFWKGAANAGHWIMVILAGIFALLALMFLLHLIPIIVLYDMPFGKKIKNAAIYTLQLFLQNVFILAVFALPFVLIAVLPIYIKIILIAVLLVYGGKWYSLIICNYEQYLSEKIIMPVYNSHYSKAAKQKRNSKRKG